MTGRLVVVSGPSGVGKTTLLKKLLENYSDKIVFSVSSTSRNPRKGEVDGIDYNFTSVEDFRKGIQNNIFLEYAVVHDNYYGTSKEYVEDIVKLGKHCLLDIDVQGGLNLMGKNIDADYIFIAPPSVETLKERLYHRSTDSDDVIKRRLENSINELKQQSKYQFVVVNDDFDTAYKNLVEIIFRK